jgi:hypothetical protein
MSKTAELKQSKYFNPDKNRTNEFFKDTKVNSCSHIVVRNGQSIAMSYNITNNKGRPLNDFKLKENKSSATKSVYRKDYTPKPYMHAGMGAKPLVPYEPESYRNRLPIHGIVMAPKNKSIIEIGDRG